MVKKRNNPRPEPAGPTLVLTRIFAAPRPLVFAAWTQGEHLNLWCAPRGFTIPFSAGDLRPGGAWRSCMCMPDGTECWLSGVYREIVENKLLVFTHAWEEKGRRGHETVVTVRFSDLGPKTKITLRQSNFESIGSRDGHQGGWSECLDNLADHLKKLTAKKKPHAHAKK
jgi:uncharacterized protein YndB with AHSA1/START domain